MQGELDKAVGKHNEAASELEKVQASKKMISENLKEYLKSTLTEALLVNHIHS